MATRIIDDGSKNFNSAGALGSDDLLFITTGSQIMDVNTDHSGGSINLARVHIGANFVGEIGTSAAPFNVEVSSTVPASVSVAAFYYLASAGACVYQAGTVDTDLCDLFLQDGDNEVAFLDGLITSYQLLRGTMEASDSGAILALVQHDGASHLKTSGSATTITAIDIMGGNCIQERQATTTNINGGTLILDAKAEAQVTINLNMGTLVFRSSGTVTNFNVTGGILIPEINRPITLTNATLDLSVEGVRELRDNPLVTISSETLQGGLQA